MDEVKAEAKLRTEAFEVQNVLKLGLVFVCICHLSLSGMKFAFSFVGKVSFFFSFLI